MKGIFLVLIIAVLSSCKTNISGTYQKQEGSGGVFENAFIRILPSKEQYLIQATNSQDVVEWTYLANYNSGKLIWTDKFLPMEISFSGDNAILKAGNGALGEYKFTKIQDVAYSNESEPPSRIK